MKCLHAAVLFLVALVVGACKDSPTGPPPVAFVLFSVPTSSPVVGTAQTLIATAKGVGGVELTGRTVSWSSSNTFVATITSGGLLAALAPGTTTITATIEGKAATAAITVLPQPVASVSITTAPDPLIVGISRQLVAVTRDANAVVLAGREVTWSSGSPAVASVTTDGLLTAITPGNVTITATSEGKSGSSTLLIQPLSGAPTIASVAPAQLIPGATATITGTAFSTDAINNRVTIRGVEAAIISASASQLTVTVPCVGSGTVPVTVTSFGRASAAFTHAVSVTARTIAVGQALILSSSTASACNELAGASPNARYLIAVFSASTSPNVQLNFEIAGNTPASLASLPSVVAVGGARLGEAVNATPEEMQNAAQDDTHWRHLERDRTEYERLRNTMRAFPSASRVNRDVVLPIIGDNREFFFTFSGGCADVSRPMQTRAVFVGARSIIWEDLANTLQSTSNSDLLGYYQRLGQIFDQDQYQSLKNTFGDPLLRDSLTDGDGRIHMVFSQKLNGSGAAAYVTSCDAFPRTASPGSNFGEVFYGSVPITAGSNVNSTNFPDGWFYFMGRTVVHEVKHIVSLSARVHNNAPTFEASWLEEGTARHAEEMWVRESLHHIAWKSNTGWGTAATNGVYCDFHPLDATCNVADPLRRPSYGMRRQFNEIREKLVAPADWSPYGDATGQSGSVFYQTAWSLVRYTIDRYAASDAAFFKTLINSSTNGTTNLAATAGVPLDQLIGGWGLALFADDYPGLASPSADIQFRTWNLRSIYTGLNLSPNWSGRFSTLFPILPIQSSFGTFAFSQVGLRGGAHAYFELSGASPALQLIQLRGTGGAAIPANTRIAITRLQ